MWSRITACRKLAETCAQYIKKGQRILVEGEVDASAWVDKRTVAPTPPRTDRRHCAVPGAIRRGAGASEGRGKELPSGSEGTKRGVPF